MSSSASTAQQREPDTGHSVAPSRSAATTLNQGPVLNADGSINNLALAPTGTPKPAALKREQFTARFVGPYSVVPGRTTTEATQTLIQGAGTANTMLHSDIQIRLVTPKDPSLPIGGVLTIFDRNLNSNTVLGFDLSAPQSERRPRRTAQRLLRPSRSTRISVPARTSRVMLKASSKSATSPAAGTRPQRGQPGDRHRHDPCPDLCPQRQLHPSQRQDQPLRPRVRIDPRYVNGNRFSPSNTENPTVKVAATWVQAAAFETRVTTGS